MAVEDTTEEALMNMSTTDRIEVLKQKHASLESELAEENKRPLPNSSVVSHIKREKLAIKDEIERLSAN